MKARLLVQAWLSWLLLAAEGSHAADATRARLSSPDPFAPQEIVLLEDSELVRHAAVWISDCSQRLGGNALPVRRLDRWPASGRRVVAAFGDQPPVAQLTPPPGLGAQGFVLQRVRGAEGGDLLVCWSPGELGCRYGLIELLRRLQVQNGKVAWTIERLVERPDFPMRICYVNFAEHLQNAFNPNLLFDSPRNRWSDADWERFVDMLSAFRFNVFEYWLVPTLFAPDALQGGRVQREFAETMNRVTAYAKRRGVSVHPIVTINTVGRNWHYHCPRDPVEKAELVALWDHWSRTLTGIESIGFFPGDPGGCVRNGCTAETYVDLCLELAQVVRRHQPKLRIEVGTWGEPMGGWGVNLWTGDTNRAHQAMTCLLRKLPEFPPDTFLSINTGFSPDSDPNSHGGDGRPYAKLAARTHPVLTWDYSASEGERTVSPRCRVRRMFERRRGEQQVGCYSGGICYTMAPRLNAVSLFASAEAWWNPSQDPTQVLHEFGRLVFGEALADIGPLLEEFEVIPDWGHYPPFPYTPERLQQSMARLGGLLDRVPATATPRLPLATSLAEYRQHLAYFAGVFRQLAENAALREALNRMGREAGLAGPVSPAQARARLAAPGDFPQRAAWQQAVTRLEALDIRSLRATYWKTVYGIYDEIVAPTDPRAEAATDVLFRRFQAE